MSDTYDQLKEMLLEKSVRTGEFTLASGKTSDLYIDCRVTALDPVGARLIGQLGWATVRERIQSEGLEIDAIGGMTMGADPISLAVGMTSGMEHPDEMIQVFNIRKEPKGHGRGKQIEGNFKEGDEVVVVDDVITWIEKRVVGLRLRREVCRWFLCILVVLYFKKTRLRAC